jgi:hypothetical protein
MHMVTRPVRAAARHFIHQFDRQDRTAGAYRVAEGDRAAVDVNAGRVETQIVHHRQRLSGEGLIEFN